MRNKLVTTLHESKGFSFSVFAEISTTSSSTENNIVTTGGYDSFTPYKDVEARLKKVGFDVIVFVPSLDEDNGMITCGNAILSGKIPTSKYKVETY